MKGEGASAKHELTSGGAFEALVALQKAFTKRIREAGLAGDTKAIHELLRALNAQTQELTTAALPPRKLSQPSNPFEDTNVYDGSLSALDLAQTVYDGDHFLHRVLMHDPDFVALCGEVQRDLLQRPGRRPLPQAAMRLTPQLAPMLCEAVARCRERLGLRIEVELYGVCGGGFNASCHSLASGRYAVFVTSELIEQFSQDELTFVIGREIGKVLLRHHLMPKLGQLTGRLTPVQALRLYAWQRSAQLSQDRIGLICSHNLPSAVSALFKMSLGVSAKVSSFRPHEYFQRCADLEPEMAREGVEIEDWYSFSPFSPMRLRGLSMFSRSETYLKLLGKEDEAELSDEQLEFQLKKMLAPMESSYLHENDETSRLTSRSVFVGSCLVALAKGARSADELSALAKLRSTSQAGEEDEAERFQERQVLGEQFALLATALSERYSLLARLSIVKDLTVIASRRGHLDEVELNALYEIAQKLGVRADFVEKMMSFSGTFAGEDKGELAEQTPIRVAC